MKLSEFLAEQNIETVNTMKSKVFQLDKNIEPEGVLLAFNDKQFFLSRGAIELLTEILHESVSACSDRTREISDAVDAQLPEGGSYH